MPSHGFRPDEVLSRTEIETMLLIAAFLKKTGLRGFTYAALQKFWSKNGWDSDIKWHTIERVVRRFASQRYGYLRRKRYKKDSKTYIFFPTDTFWWVLNVLGGSGSTA